MNDSLDTDIEIPLVVDLDGTLLLTDTIVENFSILLFRHPLAALASLRKLANRAAFKRELASHTVPDVPYLPQRQDLIRLIADRTCSGPRHTFGDSGGSENRRRGGCDDRFV